MRGQQISLEIEIPFERFRLKGELIVPAQPLGVVLFAHGSGSSRFSPRNQFVAERLRNHRLGTMLFDLLTEEEEKQDQSTGQLRFDIELLARRLADATRWYNQTEPLMAIGYFGSSTGGGAALVAETRSDVAVRAIVSRGGRPDLAGPALPKVKAPTLLMVGENDPAVVELNREAYARMQCPRELKIVPRATHLFEEPGALEQVADLAAEWFQLHFKAV